MNPDSDLGIAHGPGQNWPRIWTYLENRTNCGARNNTKICLTTGLIVLSTVCSRTWASFEIN